MGPTRGGVTGWAMALDRYRALGEPPIVLFVCEDADKAWQFARAADDVVTGRIARRGRQSSSGTTWRASACSSAPSATSTRARCAA